MLPTALNGGIEISAFSATFGVRSSGDRIHRLVSDREQHCPEIELRVFGADRRRRGPEVIEDRVADDDEVGVWLVEDVGDPPLTRGVRGPHDVRIGVQR